MPAARAFLPTDDDDALRLLKIKAVLDRIHCAAELPRELAGIQEALPEPDAAAREWLDAPELFAALASLLRDGEGELSPELFKAAVKAAGQSADRKGKQLFMPLRLVLTGRDHGPDLGALAAVLGRDEVLRRLDAAL